MKHFSLELKAISPLAIRSDHASGGAETAKYITGTALAGSLATVHRLLRSERTDEFEALFLSGQVQYPNLYPAFFKDQGMQESHLPVYPIPQTAQTCKRFRGFRKLETEEGDDDRHGVRDGLFDWTMFELSGGNNSRKGDTKSLRPLQQYKTCPYNVSHDPEAYVRCDAAVDHFEGYYRRESFEPYHMISAQTPTRLQTHTGINRETGTVQESILYNREVFAEDMRFWGMVKVSEDEKVARTFADFVEEIADEGLVRVGTGRTRGLGKVTLRLRLLQDEQNSFIAFKERLVVFNEALGKRVKDFGIENLKPFYFALTLHSPLILCDDLLRYRGTIDGETLAELAGLPPSTFQLVYQAASTRRVMGWHELWGTPRTNEYAIDTGSVFLFASTLGPEDALVRPLFELEEQGIGRRRAEGFGRVCLSDPFHLEGDLR